MISSFTGLTISTRGLYTSQSSLYVTNHNISNADTEGYTRQITNQSASSPLSSNTGTGMLGTGSEVISIEQIRDEYLDKKYWSENESLGEWEVKNDALSELESVLSELSDDGVNAILEDFYAALEELSKDPSSEAARVLIEETGVSFCNYLNKTATSLVEMQEDTNDTIKIKVDEVNALSNQIANLNEQIYNLELNGDTANDLRDQRNILVDQLSKIVDINVKEDSEHFQITLNGSYLVNHSKANEIECYEINNGSSNDGLYGIRWENTGMTLEATGGELKGYFDYRDGTGVSGEYKGLPYYMEQLDEFAQTFAKAFNEGIFEDGSSNYSGHAGGVGLDDSTDVRFFTFDELSSADFMNSGTTTDEIYSNITALNISVSLDIQEDENKIAASSEIGEEGNNENINALIELCSDSDMFNKGTPDDFFNSIITTLGTSTQQATRQAESQETIVNQIENNRLSVSSVSLDEEMANLVKYQQAYEASAKMISVWNEIYDVTINGLGI